MYRFVVSISKNFRSRRQSDKAHYVFDHASFVILPVAGR